jgi:cell surface protein SprA
VDEEPGQINTPIRSAIRSVKNLRRGGRNTNYQHNFNSSYTVPFSKIPLLNFVNSTIAYSGTYSWVAAPLVRDDQSNPDKFAQNPFGNTISNSANINLSGQANLVQLVQ